MQKGTSEQLLNEHKTQRSPDPLGFSHSFVEKPMAQGGGRNVNLLTIPGDQGWGVDSATVSGLSPLQAPQALLTVSGAQTPGCRDRGERGAAVHGTEVMLHVGAHVRVGGVEGGLPRAGRVWGKPDQRNVGDNRAAA